MKYTSSFSFCSRIVLCGVLSVLFAQGLCAQTTSLKLPTAIDSSSFCVLDNSSNILLKLNADAGFYFGGTYGTGVIPKTGFGPRVMWHPAKCSFRAGYALGAQWDDAYSGQASAAFGYATTASGNYSTALGYYTTASSNMSTALGGSTTASGSASLAAGYASTALGLYGIAMGYHSMAGGDWSIALGHSDTASGYYSTVLGSSSVSSAAYSIAIGNFAFAVGAYSMAMGNYTSTYGYSGSFILGDNSTSNFAISSANNEMTTRFAGGYRLFTSSACSTGVTLSAGGSSWSTVSDRRKKENYNKADGECFLRNLAQLGLGSWNYIGQDSKNFRHYGPMAQEIYRYYGKDAYGIIGNDTTLASADMDGIMMICLQALEKRTAELGSALNELKIEKEKTAQLQASFSELKNEFAKMRNDIQSMTEAKKEQAHSRTALYTSTKE